MKTFRINHGHYGTQQENEHAEEGYIYSTKLEEWQKVTAVFVDSEEEKWTDEGIDQKLSGIDFFHEIPIDDKVRSTIENEDIFDIFKYHNNRLK